MGRRPLTRPEVKAGEKYCIGCEKPKPIASFGKNSREADERHCYCDECVQVSKEGRDPPGIARRKAERREQARQEMAKREELARQRQRERERAEKAIAEREALLSAARLANEKWCSYCSTFHPKTAGYWSGGKECRTKSRNRAKAHMAKKRVERDPTLPERRIARQQKIAENKEQELRRQLVRQITRCLATYLGQQPESWRLCKRCNQWKLATEDNFSKQLRRGKWTWYSRCKVCRRNSRLGI